MRDLTQGKEWKGILIFTLPMIAGNLFQQMYNMVDGIVVGHYVGSNAFAAVGSAFTITMLIISLFLGISSGMSIIVSQLYGAKKYDSIHHAVSTMYVIGIVGSVICTVLGLFLAEPILKYLLAVPPEILDMSVSYLKILFCGLVFQFFYNIIGSLLRALGDSKTPLLFLVIATVVNVILDVYFVAILGWGVNGVAYATIIAQAVSCVASFVYVYIKVPMLRVTRDNLTFDKAIFAQSLRLGIPNGVQQMLVSMGIMVVQRLINSYGTDVMAAYNAGSRIEQLITMPMMQLQMALSTFVGQNIGAGKVDRAKHGYTATLKMMLLWSAVGGVVLAFFGKWLISLFVPSASGVVYEEGARYLLTMASTLWVFSTMGATQGLLRGAGDAMFPTIVTISAFVVRIVVSYAFAPTFGPIAIWVAMPCGWIVGSIVVFLRYKGGKWRSMGLLNRLEHDVKEA